MHPLDGGFPLEDLDGVVSVSHAQKDFVLYFRKIEDLPIPFGVDCVRWIEKPSWCAKKPSGCHCNFLCCAVYVLSDGLRRDFV